MVGRGGVMLAGRLGGQSGGSGALRTRARPPSSRFNDALLAVLKDGERLGYPGRFKRLQPVMQETFELDFMAEKSLGQQLERA